MVQSVIFSSMSGSALADAAASGKLMQTMMTRDGKYPAAFAAALTCVSSVIGPIIPPSIPLVLYALVSDTSVGYLFLGGVIPGLLLGAVQSGLIAAVAKRRNFPVEETRPAARTASRDLGGDAGADDAGDPARMHVERDHHAHRGRGGRRRLRAAALRRCCTAASA